MAEVHREELVVEARGVHRLLDALAEVEGPEDDLGDGRNDLGKLVWILVRMILMKMTWAVAVMILVPPLAPATMMTLPLVSVTMVVLMLLIGLSPGEIRLLRKGGTPYAEVTPGEAKSFI